MSYELTEFILLARNDKNMSYTRKSVKKVKNIEKDVYDINIYCGYFNFETSI